MSAAPARGFVHFLLLAGLVAAITACTQTPPPAATPAASVTRPAHSPGASAPSASGAGASPLTSEPPLGTCESRIKFCLPEQFQVLPLVNETLDPEKFLASTESGQGLQAFIESQGHSLDELEIARARDVTGTVGVTFFAFRVRGIEGVTLGEAFASAAINAGEDVAVATILGRTVARYNGPNGFEYLYPTGEVLYGIQATTEQLATDALGVLP